MTQIKDTLFYTRTVTDTSIVIKQKPGRSWPGTLLFIFYFVFSGLSGSSIVDLETRVTYAAIAVLVLFGFFIFSFIQIIAWIKPNREIKKAQMCGFVRVSGSKYSKKKPLVVIIDKKIKKPAQ